MSLLIFAQNQKIWKMGWIYNLKRNKKQLWIPPGFAHGFQCTSDEAEVLYKTTEYYCPASENQFIGTILTLI